MPAQYSELKELRKEYPTVPITALTATANADVKHDIIVRLGIEKCSQYSLSFNRTNLDYEVRDTKLNAEVLAAYIKQHHNGQTGIIYGYSRNTVENMAKALKEQCGLSAMHYHASMGKENKDRVQDDWYRGRIHIIVATVWLFHSSD